MKRKHSNQNPFGRSFRSHAQRRHVCRRSISGCRRARYSPQSEGKQEKKAPGQEKTARRCLGYPCAHLPRSFWSIDVSLPFTWLPLAWSRSLPAALEETGSYFTRCLCRQRRQHGKVMEEGGWRLASRVIPGRGGEARGELRRPTDRDVSARSRVKEPPSEQHSSSRFVRLFDRQCSALIMQPSTPLLLMTFVVCCYVSEVRTDYPALR